ASQHTRPSPEGEGGPREAVPSGSTQRGSLLAGVSRDLDWHAATSATTTTTATVQRCRISRPFNLFVRARFDGEALRHLAARIRRIATVVVDLRIAARVRIDGRGRGVPDVLADHGPVALPGAGPRVVQVVERVDEAVHLDVAADGERARHDGHA